MAKTLPKAEEILKEAIELLNGCLKIEGVREKMITNSIETFLEKAKGGIQSENPLDFADWLNNNWYEPAEDGMWRVNIEHPEYTLPIPEVNIFNTYELFQKFTNKEGEF